MLEDLNYEDYAGELNTKFQLTEITVELELIKLPPKTVTSAQEMFSLIFRGSKDNFLEQKLYQMSHEKLGSGKLFLVPIALDADGYKYEAAFNRLRDSG